MSGHASNEIANVGWDGKGSPFSVGYGKLMMWFFLVSDALTFGGFLVAYGFIRYSFDGAWPIGEETFDALPFLHGSYPLAYVALMTFILIISSVTMVLAVEAGHRMDRKGVTKWMLATVLGGLVFVGSQAWEWSHFIHGTKFGKVELSDGSIATAKGEFGKIQSFEVVTAGAHTNVGDIITDENISSEEGDLMHAFQHAAAKRHLSGSAGALMITLHDGTVAKVNKDADTGLELIVKQAGNDHAVSSAADESTRISEEEGAVALYYEALAKGNVVYGANLQENEYGPQSYGHFFFFVTGFHGFHVTIGIILNIIIFLNVLKGTYHRRGHYEMVEKGGLYWHFVDLVWVFVFTFFYLI
ncbi:cytochrome c oxidase subunit 3 [Brumimicrobium mesophilum]|uniref:cytochrome c oxidase subunit 3 n=1 Tax=Brumimicrobium mesophilum TaxID=392717 RepID=UPI000D143B04|nr:cytochrome c oxidase subunit 3 [Brumimicrobium mesophilum]